MEQVSDRLQFVPCEEQLYLVFLSFFELHFEQDPKHVLNVLQNVLQKRLAPHNVSICLHIYPPAGKLSSLQNKPD